MSRVNSNVQIKRKGLGGHMHTRHACARGSADVTARAASVRRSTLPIRRLGLDRRREGRQVGAVAQGGASEAPGAAVENGCRRGFDRGKIAAAVGEGEYRNCHGFSFSLLLLVNVFNRDPQIN